jgi:hypothetical protein
MTVDIEIEHADGKTEKRSVTLDRMYNFGSATRNPEDAVAHQEEVAKVGVGIAFDIPAPRVYPISPHNLVTDGEVFIHNAETSGEVEIVILHDGGELFIGVGSDHTDRQLERTSIVWSKQAYPNVLAPRLWPIADLRDHWDDLVLRSWVDGRSYQDVGVNIFMHPDEMLAKLADRIPDLPAHYILYSGTYVSVDKSLGFGSEWRFELADPTLGRAISHSYRLTNILAEIIEGYRVPLVG